MPPEELELELPPDELELLLEELAPPPEELELLLEELELPPDELELLLEPPDEELLELPEGSGAMLNGLEPEPPHPARRIASITTPVSGAVENFPQPSARDERTLVGIFLVMIGTPL